MSKMTVSGGNSVFKNMSLSGSFHIQTTSTGKLVSPQQIFKMATQERESGVFQMVLGKDTGQAGKASGPQASILSKHSHRSLVF